MVKNEKVVLWGGIGKKKSNNGTQWYIQDRIYDSEGLSPALTQACSNYYIIIRKPVYKEHEQD